MISGVGIPPGVTKYHRKLPRGAFSDDVHWNLPERVGADGGRNPLFDSAFGAVRLFRIAGFQQAHDLTGLEP